MPGRNIAFNTRIIIDVLDIAEYENTEAVFISLDFKKAFDRVELCTLCETLRYFKFL